MARKIRETINQLLYKKQIRRIRRALLKERSKGYDVRELLDIVTQERPSRVTKKTLEELRKITPEYIRQRAKYIEYIPPKGTPLIPPKEEEKRYYIQPVSTDFGMVEDTIDLYSGDIIASEPVDWGSYERAKQDWSDDVDRRSKEYAERYFKVSEPEPEPEEPPSPYSDYAQYNQEYTTMGQSEFTIYDEDGNIVTVISPQFSGTDDKGRPILEGYIDQATGEMFKNRQAVEMFLVHNDVSIRPTYDPSLDTITDIGDYMIQQIYDRTEMINEKTNNVLWELFDTVRQEIGDEAFVRALTESNGFRSAFEVLDASTHAGADYKESFTRFGSEVLNILPMTEEQAQTLENAFNEIIDVAYDGEH